MAHVATEWPAMSCDEARDRLTAPGARFEMEQADVRGVHLRVWKNALPHVRALMEGARQFDDRIATVYEDERVTYAAQHRAVAALARHLATLGVCKGDRVAIAMRNLPEWPVAFLATLGIGAIAVPLNAWWSGEELAFGLTDSGSRVLIADAERWSRIMPHRAALLSLKHMLVSRGESKSLPPASRLEGVIGTSDAWSGMPDDPLPPVAIEPDDAAAIMYTSGTSGRPKGALSTHRNMTTFILSAGYGAARSFMRRGEPLPTPRPRVALMVVPLFHTTGLSSGLLGPMSAGGTTIFMRKFDPLAAMQIIEREQVNSTGGVPTIAWQILDHPERHRYDLSSLDTVAYGGAASAPELARRLRSELNVHPGNGWGMTETSAVVTTNLGEDYLKRPDSCGQPVPVADLSVRDPDGVAEVAPRSIGELWVRGPMVVAGYWNMPEATAANFVEGWVRTGDLARIDEEGFCYIVDRAKDVVIRGGENIYSIEVENVLQEHPAVDEAALVGVPHRVLGEVPAAVVRLAFDASATEFELAEWVRTRLAGFKVPVKFEITHEPLPRNANGKVMKQQLRQIFVDVETS